MSEREKKPAKRMRLGKTIAASLLSASAFSLVIAGQVWGYDVPRSAMLEVSKYSFFAFLGVGVVDSIHLNYFNRKGSTSESIKIADRLSYYAIGLIVLYWTLAALLNLMELENCIGKDTSCTIKGLEVVALK